MSSVPPWVEDRKPARVKPKAKAHAVTATRAKPQPFDPIKAFHAAVANRQARGLTLAESVAAVKRECPAIMRLYREETGTAAPSTPPPSRKTEETMQHDIDCFHAAVEVMMKQGKSKSDATRAVIREQPDLHRAYLAAFNRQHGRPRAAAALEK